MFYNKSLMNSTSVGTVWRIGNSVDCEKTSATLGHVCSRLNKWMESDAIESQRRLSLRTSSTLLLGATKLYKEEVNNLIQSVTGLDDTVRKRKRKLSDCHDLSSYDSTTDSSVKSPEKMLRCTNDRSSLGRISDSFSRSVTRKIKLKPSEIRDEENEPDRETNFVPEYGDKLEDVNKTEESGDSTNNTLNSSPKTKKDLPRSNTRNKETQTVETTGGANETRVPHACVLIYKDSNIPSHIIISNVDVRAFGL